MKRVCSLLAVWSLVVAVAGAQDPARKAPSPPYNMATYQLIALKPGPEAPRLGNTTEGNKVVAAHVQYMYKLAGESAYAAAGPFLDGLEISGIIVVIAPTPERATALAAEDPAVKAGMFTVEVVSFMAPEGWFGKWASFGKFEKVFFGFLVNGPNRGQDAETAMRLQAEHLAYMEGQANEGKLVLAGPITTAGERRGIVVYRVADEAEARKRGEGDPMIKAGRLALDLHPWQVPIGALPATGK
jgi:uncharacterized protein YciI